MRLEQLLGESPKRSGAPLEWGAVILASLLSALAVACAATLAAWLSPGNWALSVAVACSV